MRPKKDLTEISDIENRKIILREINPRETAMNQDATQKINPLTGKKYPNRRAKERSASEDKGYKTILDHISENSTFLEYQASLLDMDYQDGRINRMDYYTELNLLCKVIREFTEPEAYINSKARVSEVRNDLRYFDNVYEAIKVNDKPRLSLSAINDLASLDKAISIVKRKNNKKKKNNSNYF